LQKSNTFKNILPMLCCLLVIVIDYITKLIIVYFPPKGMYGEPLSVIGEVFKVIFSYNDNFLFGLSFGINNPFWEKIIYTIVYVILIGIVIFFYKMIRTEKAVPRVFFGIVLGGMLGNFINIIFGGLIFFGEPSFFFGKLISWISFGLSVDKRLPPFNLADLSIIIGIICLLIYIISHKQSDIFKGSKEKTN